jgi:hypothetical protein
VPVAHFCHLCYSGGRDQEDHISKPAQANSSKGPISKITHKKRLVQDLSSSPSTGKKKEALSVNGLNFPKKSHRLDQCLLFTKISPQWKRHTHRLKVKRCEIIFQKNRVQKKAGTALLTSENTIQGKIVKKL